MKIYEEHFSLSEIDYFYVPGINSWQKQILSLFDINEKKLITKCEKKISNNIDLESSLTLSYRNIEIKLKTSLTKNLENNFIIYTDKDVITLRNIFNISLESALEFKDNKNKNLYNLDKFNSYHYEIMNISNLLINRKIFENDSLDVSLKKIENLRRAFFFK